MFIKYAKSSNPAVLLLLFVLGIIVWIGPVIYGRPTSPMIHTLPFVQNMNLFFLSNASVFSALAFLLLFFQSWAINEISVKFDMTPKNTYVAALVYFTIMSLLPNMHALNQVLICNIFLIPVLSLMLKFYEKSDAFFESFYVGLLISLASIFFYPLILLLLFVFISFIVFRLFSWREWLITILGITVPFLFIFTYYFWYDGIPGYINSWFMAWKSLAVPASFSSANTIQFITFSIILLFSFVFMLTKMNIKNIVTRKMTFAILWFIVFTVSVSFFGLLSSQLFIMISAVPASLIISNYLSNMKNKWFAELLFFCLLAEMIFFKFF